MSGSAVDAEATIERIQQKPGVAGFIICGAETVDENGDSRCEIHRKGTSITAEVAQQYADKFSRLTALASSITRDLNPENELMFFRVKTKKQEVLIAPKYEMDGSTKFHIITIQQTNLNK